MHFVGSNYRPENLIGISTGFLENPGTLTLGLFSLAGQRQPIPEPPLDCVSQPLPLLLLHL